MLNKSCKIIIISFFLVVFTNLRAQDATELCSSAKINAYGNLQKAGKIAYPGDSSIDVTYYKLDLNITYSPHYLDGKATVNAKPDSAALDQFYLDLYDNMTVDSIKLGNSKLTFMHQDNKLTINLEKVYTAGEEFSIDIYYQGNPESGSGFGSFVFSSHNGNPVIWTLSEPYGSSEWFPCKDTPADKVDSSDVWITADTYFYSVSNGSLISADKNSDGTQTFKWKNHHPIAQYLISIAMTNYAIYTNTFYYGNNQSMPVIHYNYPENLTDSRKQILDETVTMLEVFSDLFGIYPYMDEKYAHAECGFRGGMEHQTATSIGVIRRNIDAHELAHQWFGDKITCKDWHHIWLNEGFATYCVALYGEATNGKQTYNNIINNDMLSAYQAGGSIYVQNISSVSQIFNSNRSYNKGAVVLHMLRGVLGDTDFFNILKSYANDPELAYGVATTEDFQRVAEEVSGKDLEYFFQEWIYGSNYPKYSVNWNYQTNDNESFTVSVTISQETNSNPAYFTMPIDLKFNTSSGDTTVNVFNNQQNQTFVINLNSKPSDLQFDPDNWILKNISNIQFNPSVQTPTKYDLVQNYPNPFNATTKISYSIPVAANVKIIIADVLGNKIETLVNKFKEAGEYSLFFNGENLSSGVYFYILEAGNTVLSKKMVLLK